MDNNFLSDILSSHIEHDISIVSYGGNICLECNDCNEIILDSEIYTLIARNDIDE